MFKQKQRAGNDRQDTKKIDSAIKLRLLQTTDLHMHVLPFDYTTMRPTPTRGLANLVKVIDDLRSDGVPTLLFDTGDFLQGNPLADAAMTPDEIDDHPIARAFNDMDYDAIVLGNHDFDYGLASLARVIKQINRPVLSANVVSEFGTTTFPASTMISVGTGPQTPPIKVGVIGLTTPVISLTTVSGGSAVTTADPVKAAESVVTALRGQGADIIVALCHFGIDPDDHIENVAADIAAIDGIDVVMAGHTHETFPTGTPHTGPLIDTDQGTIHAKPVTMAGAFGEYLGVIELDLIQRGNRTEITGQTAQLHKATTLADPHIFANVRPLHNATVAAMNKHVAQTLLPFSTAFSLIQPDLTQYLLACSRQMYMEQMLTNTTYARLPILSTAAPFSTGSRLDPHDFISVPPGPITRSDVTAIYPFNNAAVAILRNGAQIKDWLEASALIYQTLRQDQKNQTLIDPQIPPYRFDTIFGLTYEIDVSAPAGHRIEAIRHKGTTVQDTDRFVLVTSTNRLEQRQNIPPEDVICISRQNSHDILVHSLGLQSPIEFTCPDVWNFTPLPNTTANFWTSPAANITDCKRALADNGIDATGFRRFTLSFDAPATLA